MSWLKSKKIWILVMLLSALAAYGVLSYMYKPHAQIEDQKITFTGDAASLIKEASSNETAIINSIVAIEGKVSGKAADGFTVSGSIFCQPKDNAILSQVAEGKSIKVKGRFIGYDDLLEEVKLDQVILSK